MSIFDAYDQEFNSLCQEITKNISALKSVSNSEHEKIEGFLRQIDGLLSQGTELIKQMEVEVRSHDPATRTVLLAKVTQYKKSMLQHKSDYERYNLLSFQWARECFSNSVREIWLVVALKCIQNDEWIHFGGYHLKSFVLDDIFASFSSNHWL